MRTAAEAHGGRGEWTHYERDFDAAFDFKVFDLLSVGLHATETADEILLRNLSLGSPDKVNATIGRLNATSS
ncbi:MAG: hypothetical protein IKC14_01205 [Kiritimatiellae bacterium]|nr:hypothetical protein [Kiritimatiellia bacterium]